MLDQLVESKNNERENKKRGGYLLTTAALVVCLCFSAVLYSLFAKDFGGGTQNLELSMIISPIDDAAPAEVIEKPEKTVASEKNKNELPTRQANILKIEESPIDAPKTVSVVPNTQKSRPNGQFIISGEPEADGTLNANFGKSIDGNKVGGIEISDDSESNGAKPNVKVPPPPPIKKPIEEKTATKSAVPTISGGVVNGKARFLPKPAYTAAAKSLRLNGEVSIQVLIDETGKVISAKAVNGHPLFRNEAENAARNAKFEPTLLSDKPVKVSGLIVYKFSIQ